MATGSSNPEEAPTSESKETLGYLVNTIRQRIKLLGFLEDAVAKKDVFPTETTPVVIDADETPFFGIRRPEDNGPCVAMVYGLNSELLMITNPELIGISLDDIYRTLTPFATTGKYGIYQFTFTIVDNQFDAIPLQRHQVLIGFARKRDNPSEKEIRFSPVLISPTRHNKYMWVLRLNIGEKNEETGMLDKVYQYTIETLANGTVYLPRGSAIASSIIGDPVQYFE